MNGGDQYVIRVSCDGELLNQTIDSAEGAHQYAKNMGWGGSEVYTVHKLGPAIEPPEPREWVCVDHTGSFVNGRPQTRGSAEACMVPGDGRYLMRLVPEDAP